MDSTERTDRLKSLSLLQHLSREKLDELVKVLKVQAFPAGNVVFEEASRGDTMFLVAEGQVRIEKKVEAGGFKELALLSPGDFFGEMALLEETPRSARAVAHTDATLFSLGRGDLDRWLKAEPVMALGFFVELMRGLSHRLRRTSEELVLLHDLSHLVLRKFADESTFLAAVLRLMVPHMEGDWSGAAYLYNEFNEDVDRVGAEGRATASLPPKIGAKDAANRWLDASTYCVALPNKDGAPLGFLLMRNALAMNPREKAEIEIALSAAAHLLSSALQNIKHETEQALRARLEHQKTYGASL